MTWHYNNDERSVFDNHGTRVCLLPDLRNDSESNGVLIAAAPDMLEALESALDVIEYEDQPGLYKKIENALNKAKGL